MRSDTLLLRPAAARHASEISALLGELGHPASPAEVAVRLEELHRLDPEGLLLVAELDEHAVGLVAAHLTPMLHRDGPVGRVTTLVVSAAHRGQGIGDYLLQMAVSWCRERGAKRIELTSGDPRGEAHAFYEHRGWRREGLRFVLEEK